MRNKNVALALFLLFIPFCAMAGATVQPLPPRMWKAVSPNGSGPATTLYILGVTHMGLSTEYDDYFENQVKPAFQAADIFLFEGAGGREKEIEAYPVCDPAVLGEEERKIVDAERATTLKLMLDELETQHIRSQSKEPANDVTLEQLTYGTSIYVNSRDEFQLIELQNNFAAAAAARQHAKRREPETAGGLTLYGSVVDALHASRPEMPVRSLDSRYGVRRAYCSMGKERIKFFVALTQRVDLNSDAAVNATPLINAETYHVLSGNDVTSAEFPHPLRMTDKTILCQRNQEWMNEIQTSLDGKTHFVAVGVNHLFKVEHEYAHCNGLLYDLKKLGWSVERVEAQATTN